MIAVIPEGACGGQNPGVSALKKHVQSMHIACTFHAPVFAPSRGPSGLGRLDDAAGPKVQDAVHPGRELGIVGGDERREAGRAHEVEQHREDPVRRLGVEVAGGLVGEEERRPVDQRAGDGDALLLAAGELGRAVVEAVAEADAGQELACALGGGGARRAGGALRQRRRSPARRIPAAGGGTGRRSRRCRGGAGCGRGRRGPPSARRAAGPSRRSARRGVPAMCSKVDLPAPEGATRATTSPAPSATLAPSSTVTAAAVPGL